MVLITRYTSHTSLTKMLRLYRIASLRDAILDLKLLMFLFGSSHFMFLLGWISEHMKLLRNTDWYTKVWFSTEFFLLSNSRDCLVLSSDDFCLHHRRDLHIHILSWQNEVEQNHFIWRNWLTPLIFVYTNLRASATYNFSEGFNYK